MRDLIRIIEAAERLDELEVMTASGSDVRVFENPVVTRLLSLLKNSHDGELRGIADGDTIYWWDAYHAVHGDVAPGLGLDGGYLDNRLHLFRQSDGTARFVWVDDEWKKFPFHPQVRRYMASNQIMFNAGSAGTLSGPEFLQSLKDDGLL